ncbi:unnamed protein product [Pipistrellus nathusii]|uniref:Uncharacterized protein n=1 Tax=Pipistrellus nathusii TaxID=59473 RepID=A0ABN9Z670_PIPNA
MITVYFPLDIFSSISLLNILYFSEYKSFTFLAKFILTFHNIFYAKLNGIVGLISLSENSLLVYKSTINFWVLILCPATLMNSFIKSRCVFCVESLGFSRYNIMSPMNNKCFTSSFPIWMPFISSSCLIAVA